MQQSNASKSTGNATRAKFSAFETMMFGPEESLFAHESQKDLRDEFCRRLFCCCFHYDYEIICKRLANIFHGTGWTGLGGEFGTNMIASLKPVIFENFNENFAIFSKFIDYFTKIWAKFRNVHW